MNYLYYEFFPLLCDTEVPGGAFEQRCEFNGAHASGWGRFRARKTTLRLRISLAERSPGQDGQQRIKLIYS